MSPQTLKRFSSPTYRYTYMSAQLVSKLLWSKSKDGSSIGATRSQLLANPPLQPTLASCASRSAELQRYTSTDDLSAS